MKINLNEIDQHQFNQVLKNKNINMDLADVFLKYIEQRCFDLSDVDISNTNITNYEKVFYDSLINEMEFDLEDEETSKIAATFVKPGIKCLDINEYLDNPYNKNIKAKKIIDGTLTLTYLTYAKTEGFFYNDISVLPNEYYKEITNIGFFTEEYKFLALFQRNVIWMSINPNEIETMKPAINEAKGDVVTFGLGLGYFAYMVSLKEDVKSVTIIEYDKAIINMFTNYLLPQFKNKDKIKIVETNAYNFLEENKNSFNYDYAYFDLWHNPNDGLELYLKINKYEKKYKNTKFGYWLEEGILALLRRCLITLLEEENDGSTDKDYYQSESFTDDVINRLHFIFKYTPINSYYDIKKLLSDDSLRRISRKLYFQ